MRQPTILGQAIFTTEKLAYWYFRLNGCLTIENFVVHPDIGTNQRTDVDVIGIRFPHRRELLQNSMSDDSIFANQTKPFIFLAEIKLSQCALNPTWKRPAEQNMERALRAVGALSPAEVDTAASCLYTQQIYENDAYEIRLITVADNINAEYKRSRPALLQLTWTDMLKFIYRRFCLYPDIKCSHPQWDECGHELWRACFPTPGMPCSEHDFVLDVRARLRDKQGNGLGL